MIATGYCIVTIATIFALVGASRADGQERVTLPDASVAPAIDYMANARRFAGRRSYADCQAEATASGDIVVCGPGQDEGLPIQEVYGPIAGSTDGAAVDARGVPCGASISNHCYSGVDLPALFGAAVGVIGLIIDPDKNLGEGTRIPDRFRGANR